MPTFEANTVLEFVGSNAQFQNWVQKMEAAILASGLLEVAPDTGQIDPTTVVKPAANAYAGYRIYRAKDALQATKPMFLKVEYGIASGGSDTQERFTVSTSTDGAGAPTGVVSTPAVSNGAGSTGAGQTASVFGGGGPAAMFVYVRLDTATTGPVERYFGLGRFVDPSTGLANNQGMFYVYGNGNSTTAVGTVFYTDFTAAWASATWDKFFPNLNAAPNSLGTAVKIRAVKGQIIRLAEHSELPYLIGVRSEFPSTQTAAASKFDATAWGSPRTWLPVRPSVDNAVPAAGAASSVIFRWD